MARELKLVTGQVYQIKAVTATDGTGGVYIIAENETSKWYLLRINRDGTFTRMPGISPDSGFKVDEKGRILERA